MHHPNPYCQMCKKELCVVCKQQLDNCKCPCPNFVICRYCDAQEKTLPPCDEMFPAVSNTGVGGWKGFGGGGALGKMTSLFMLMMMNANKQGGGKSCECSRRSHNMKWDRDCSSRRDCEPSSSGHPCCCKTVQSKPMPNCSQLVVMPNACPQNPCLPNQRLPNPCHQNCCTCSSRGDAHNGKCREPINQYFFGSDCSPQPTAPLTYGSHPPPPEDGIRTQGNRPERASNPNDQWKLHEEDSTVPAIPNDGREPQHVGSPTRGSPTMLKGPRKPGNRKTTALQ